MVKSGTPMLVLSEALLVTLLRWSVIWMEGGREGRDGRERGKGGRGGRE